MPRKISVKRASVRFQAQIEGIEKFLRTSEVSNLSIQHQAWCYDHAIVRIYRGFEELMLKTIIAAININPATISYATGISFPKHLSQNVCRYLVVGKGYFDFRGRDGLIQKIRAYIPEAHPLVTLVKDSRFKQSLERLFSLRNFAAHESVQAKNAALKATGQKRLKSSGRWLLKHERLFKVASDMKLLAAELRTSAPY
jgi:hypothetical protein